MTKLSKEAREKIIKIYEKYPVTLDIVGMGFNCSLYYNLWRRRYIKMKSYEEAEEEIIFKRVKKKKKNYMKKPHPNWVRYYMEHT